MYVLYKQNNLHVCHGLFFLFLSGVNTRHYVITWKGRVHHYTTAIKCANRKYLLIF